MHSSAIFLFGHFLYIERLFIADVMRLTNLTNHFLNGNLTDWNAATLSAFTTELNGLAQHRILLKLIRC